MSSFQIVRLRALDRPLSDKQLEFMNRQSSRAEFTKWEFKVEYQYSSFRGDVDGMLRNGYDIFLTYSNLGYREIRMRLPNGLPFAESVWSKYISAEGLKWTADASGEAINAWLTNITVSRQRDIMRRLLLEDPSELKAELWSDIRDSQPGITWPVETPRRTVAELFAKCEQLRTQEDEKQRRRAAVQAKREAEKAEKQRQARLAAMQSAPDTWLKKASELVEIRGTENYREAASILADLRDAVGGEQGNKIARQHAAHLARKYPTLNVLKSSLRKKQLLD